MNRTKHGFTKHQLRDLNGPNMNGKYNGRSSCNHMRTETVTELRAVEYGDGPKQKKKVRSVKVERCKECGAEVDFTMREVKREAADGVELEVSP